MVVGKEGDAATGRKGISNNGPRIENRGCRDSGTVELEY